MGVHFRGLPLSQGTWGHIAREISEQAVTKMQSRESSHEEESPGGQEGAGTGRLRSGCGGGESAELGHGPGGGDDEPLGGNVTVWMAQLRSRSRDGVARGGGSGGSRCPVSWTAGSWLWELAAQGGSGLGHIQKWTAGNRSGALAPFGVKAREEDQKVGQRTGKRPE